MKWNVRIADAKAGQESKNLSTQSRDFYQKIYEEYSNCIIDFFRRQGYGVEEAQDGLQEVYLRVIRLSEPKLMAEAPKAYLLKVATNWVRSQYRKQAPIKVVKQDILEIDDIASLEPSPEHSLLVREQTEIVKKSILELSDKHREIFLMHRMEGRSCKEISQALNIPLRTVQRRLSDALAYCVVRLKKETGVNTNQGGSSGKRR